MKIELFHGDGRSAVVAGGTVIEYERRSHRSQSEGDFRLIKTELLTYGEPGAQAVVDYLTVSRNR